eukprot:TRINITY_DN1914_c0_g1_i1.p2 TRINITY_DN1914_c0_g1~~TRINITY_DN1914_c0_g1_i1.p2  ORF type:complete len:162 (+),score=53.20 TRINITY_DN1914_c0_g1_i1:138-623(+)
MTSFPIFFPSLEHRLIDKLWFPSAEVDEEAVLARDEAEYEKRLESIRRLPAPRPIGVIGDDDEQEHDAIGEDEVDEELEADNADNDTDGQELEEEDDDDVVVDLDDELHLEPVVFDGFVVSGDTSDGDMSMDQGLMEQSMDQGLMEQSMDQSMDMSMGHSL